MFELTGCVAFGVDVGDLLQLECTLHRQRIVYAAAEVEHVPGFGQAVGQLLELALVLQHG